ncbi:putative protein-synthesizing GTPase [Helianthus annuus]|nr:putative protein-synthesizing GTPase [Helianthus annuus]KAJ0687146.1 putative protein-synthesizing GTPase [Helianthus annuus]
MATMLNGAAIMDGALLLIATNESSLQPQTFEHLAAVEIMKLKHIIILQNKVDLVQESVAINQHDAIQKFIQVGYFCDPFCLSLVCRYVKSRGLYALISKSNIL